MAAGHGAGAVGVLAVLAVLAVLSVVLAMVLHSSGASPTSAPTTGARSPVASDPVGPGADCGAAGQGPMGVALDLVVASGEVTCSTAAQVMRAYVAAPAKQGSGGFATVEGWSCSHNSLAGFDQTGQFASCQRGGDTIATRSATFTPTPAAS